MQDERLVKPRDWIRYAAARRGLRTEEIEPGDLLVATPIARIYEVLTEYFGAEPWDKWIYPPDARWGLHTAVIRGLRVSFAKTGIGPAEMGWVEEALDLELRQVFFAGIAGGLGEDLDIGDLVVPFEGICEDGFSQHYIPPGISVSAPRSLVETLVDAAKTVGARVHVGRVWSLPTPYRELDYKASEYRERWGCLAVEMEVCSVYALAKYYGADAVALLAISDIVYPRERSYMGFDDERLEETINTMPRILETYVERLSRGPAPPQKP